MIPEDGPGDAGPAAQLDDAGLHVAFVRGHAHPRAQLVGRLRRFLARRHEEQAGSADVRQLDRTRRILGPANEDNAIDLGPRIECALERSIEKLHVEYLHIGRQTPARSAQRATTMRSGGPRSRMWNCSTRRRAARRPRDATRRAAIAAKHATTRNAPGSARRCDRAGLDAFAVMVASRCTTYDAGSRRWSWADDAPASAVGFSAPRSNIAPRAAPRTPRRQTRARFATATLPRGERTRTTRAILRSQLLRPMAIA